MSRFSRSDKKWLGDRFGDRANFSPTERSLYGHDIAAIPSLFKPLVGRTTPNAIVQPETEEELRELVRWANGRGLPLVPRGKGSSGYGGLIPIRRGIVVDFFRMKDVLSVSPIRCRGGLPGTTAAISVACGASVSRPAMSSRRSRALISSR